MFLQFNTKIILQMFNVRNVYCFIIFFFFLILLRKAVRIGAFPGFGRKSIRQRLRPTDSFRLPRFYHYRCRKNSVLVRGSASVVWRSTRVRVAWVACATAESVRPNGPLSPPTPPYAVRTVRRIRFSERNRAKTSRTCRAPHVGRGGALITSPRKSRGIALGGGGGTRTYG